MHPKFDVRINPPPLVGVTAGGLLAGQCVSRHALAALLAADPRLHGSRSHAVAFSVRLQ